MAVTFQVTEPEGALVSYPEGRKFFQQGDVFTVESDASIFPQYVDNVVQVDEDDEDDDDFDDEPKPPKKSKKSKKGKGG